MNIAIAEKNREVTGERKARGDPVTHVKMASPMSAKKDTSVMGSNVVSPGSKKLKKDQISDINIIKSKYKEADYVGRETIDLINKEAAGDINASHMNKTDRLGSK